MLDQTIIAKSSTGSMSGTSPLKARRKAIDDAQPKTILPKRRAPSKLVAGQTRYENQGKPAGGKPLSKRARASVLAPSITEMPASRTLSKRAKAICHVSPIDEVPSALDLSRDEVGQRPSDTQSIAAADLIASIREIHKRRNDFLAEEGSLVRRMKRIVSRYAGNKKTSDAALKAFIPTYSPMRPFVDSLKFIRTARMQEEKILVRYARQLPVWSTFMQHIRGCGPLTLGQIIGDAGDLSKYDSIPKLWKRMGLAVIDGQRQRKTRDKKLAQLNGYNPRRRALMFIVGNNIIKLNKGEYRRVYDAEKQRQIAKAAAEGLKIAPAAKIPKARAAEFRSEKHIHLRAKRYMEKRLLRDLWRAWRDQINVDIHHPVVSPAATSYAEAA